MKKQGSNKKPARRAGAPAPLHPDAVAFGERIRGAWQLDEAAEGYLVQAIENLSVAIRAQETVKREGLVFETATGYKLPHPAWRIAKEASSLYMKAMHYLGLDMEATGTVGRPVG